MFFCRVCRSWSGLFSGDGGSEASRGRDDQRCDLLKPAAVICCNSAVTRRSRWFNQRWQVWAHATCASNLEPCLCLIPRAHGREGLLTQIFRHSSWQRRSRRPRSWLSTLRSDNNRPESKTHPPSMLKPKHTAQTLIQLRGVCEGL